MFTQNVTGTNIMKTKKQKRSLYKISEKVLKRVTIDRCLTLSISFPDASLNGTIKIP